MRLNRFMVCLYINKMAKKEFKKEEIPKYLEIIKRYAQIQREVERLLEEWAYLESQLPKQQNGRAYIG